MSATPAASALAASSAAPAAANASPASTGPARNGSSFQPSGPAPSPEGFYQGSGVLVSASRPCARQDSAQVEMRRNRVSFAGDTTGVVSGPAAAGSQVRVVNATDGLVRLVGTFANGTFVGSLSNGSCVYDYALNKVVGSQQAGYSALGAAAVLNDYTKVRRAQTIVRPVPPAPDDPQAASAAAQRQARRGEQLLGEGKIVEARRLFERAALAGNARGALGLGMTYDPSFLSSIDSHGTAADPLVAKVWYLRAQMFGDKEARNRLAALEAWKPG